MTEGPPPSGGARLGGGGRHPSGAQRHGAVGEAGRAAGRGGAGGRAASRRASASRGGTAAEPAPRGPLAGRAGGLPAQGAPPPLLSAPEARVGLRRGFKSSRVPARLREGSGAAGIGAVRWNKAASRRPGPGTPGTRTPHPAPADAAPGPRWRPAPRQHPLAPFISPLFFAVLRLAVNLFPPKRCSQACGASFQAVWSD